MGKSKELAELGDVVTQSGGNVGIGISTVVAPLHVGTEGTHGITAWFGDESSFVDNASYHYTDARVGISGRDSDNTDHGAGIEFTSRNTGSSNWLHGYLVHNRDGAFAFGTGGAGTSSAPERMRIDASGRVTMPYQPAFHATIANSFTGNGSVAGSETITFDSASVNVGGHYDTSTGRFTAPVAGVYHFSYTVSPGTNSISARYLRVQLLKNGATYLNPHNTISNESGDADYNIVSASGNVYLNANDYVHVVFGSSTATNTLYFFTQMTFFSGYLIG